MNLSAEKELVLQLIQFNNPNVERIKELTKEKLDWAEVSGHLVYNRVAGVAHHVLRSNSIPGFNREFEFGLYAINELQALRAKEFNPHVHAISDALSKGGVKHALLKGALLVSTFYPPGCRMSNDVDVLVAPDDLTACNNILREKDFIQGFYNKAEGVIKPATRAEILNRRMNFGEVVAYSKLVDHPGFKLLEVDINFSLDWTSKGTTQPVIHFLNHVQEYSIGEGQTIWSLSKEHFLAHLCVHLYKEAYVINWVRMQRDLGIYKFLDLYAFLTKPGMEIDVQGFVDIAEENRLVEACYYSFELARQMFPSLEANVTFINLLQRLKPKDVSYLNRIIDPQNDKIEYEWKVDFLTRLFDLRRHEQLEKRMRANA